MPLAISSPGTLGVLIADSNRMQAQLLAGALRRRPEFRVVTCPMEHAAILQAVATKRPRVALLSLHPSRNLPEAVVTLRQFHLAHRDIPKVLLVDVCDRQLLVSAFRSGVRGIFTLTDSNLRLLCKCLVRVAAGQVWANTEQLNFLMDLISEVPSLRVLSTNGASLLTPREEQVVAVVAEGLSNRQVARELNLSEHTVKKYLFRIFEKLGISSRVELVLYAMNNGDPRQAEWLAGAPTAPTSETPPAKV
ncbi:MAG: response regulator transcription factor [Candidatus Sulfotelmatobacter sp.]